MRVAALLIGAVLALSVLWLAGEQHRENCIRSGQSSCSVLPWDGGESRASQSGPLTRQECLLATRAARLQGEPEPDC